MVRCKMNMLKNISNTMAIKLLMAIAVLAAHGAVQADLYQKQPDGWVWYQDSSEKPKKAIDKPKQIGSVTVVGEKSPRETLKAMGDEMEEAEAQSILNPTPDNIRHALMLKKQILAMTNVYADRVERTIWQNPELDYTLERPMRQDTIFAAGQVQADKLKVGLAEAGKTSALVYVMRSDCPYCKKFSPLLKDFASIHGMTIIPISLDGHGNSDFPYPKRDLSILRVKGMIPEVVPALYLVNPRKDQVEPVGFGLMNASDLENRVALAAGINIYEGTTSSARTSTIGGGK